MFLVRYTQLGRVSKRYTFIILALLSATFNAIYVTMDVYFLNVILPDALVYGLLTVTIGIITAFFLLLIFSIPIDRKRKRFIGTLLDPHFHGLVIPTKKVFSYILFSALGGTMATFSYFYLTFITDPSTVLPLAKFVILYLLFAELWSERDTPTIIEVQAITMITLGVFLVAASDINIDLFAMILVFGPMNVGSAIFTYFQKLAKESTITPRRKYDSITLRVWTQFLMMLFLSLSTIPLLTQEQITIFFNYFPSVFWFVALDMAIVFFASITYIRALGIGKMSIVNALTSVSVILGIPFTIVGFLIAPHAFPPPSDSLFIWIVKIIAVVLVTIGIISISISEIKSYLLLKVRPGCIPHVMDELSHLKGFVSIAAVSGEYAIVAKVRLRGLAKVYNMMIRYIENIKGIEQIISVMIAKEWERI